VVSRAVTPEVPSFPKKLPIVGFATLLTLMLSAGAVIARALLAEGARIGAVRGGHFDSAEERERREPVLERPVFAFPEAMPPARWSEADEAGEAAEVDAHPARVAESASAFDLGPLVERIASAPRGEAARTGHCVLIVETEDAQGTPSLFEALSGALSDRGTLVAVDLNAPSGQAPSLGLTDLVAGEAAFLDAIQADRDSKLHRIAAGELDGTILFDEPDALVLTFEAMAEAYDWVLCRIHAVSGAVDLLDLVAGQMDSVVIASNASAEDPALADLYAIAEDAGAGQILVAQDRAVTDADIKAADGAGGALRLNAA
ncbi:MAG: lipopolysaccharide biosynthesis protein, partial [Parafilimonas terrae]|nr:lipopolysaccharide biosynthesis protein [Parafilimonas terrae]